MEHLLEIVLIAAVGLLLLGPKTLQSLARGAGKSAGQARDVKDKIMTDLPVNEIHEAVQSIPRVPTNPRAAIEYLLRSDPKATERPEQVSTPPAAEPETREQ